MSNDVAFVSLGTSIGVLDTSDRIPRLVQTIALANITIFNDNSKDTNGAGELIVFQNKQELWAPYGLGAIVLSVEKAVKGEQKALFGVLSDPTFSISSANVVKLSAQEDYCFVSQEYGSNATQSRGAVQVFKISRMNGGTVTGTSLRYTELQLAVVGISLSGDG